MKKIVQLLIIISLATSSKAQDAPAHHANAKQTANGNFIAIKKEPAPGKATGKTIIYTDGKSYPVFESAKGKLYYTVTNKKGNPSRKYINL